MTTQRAERDFVCRRLRPSFFPHVGRAAAATSRDADQIAAEVVQHLVALVDAAVEVKLEISADVPSGVPDEVVRTVIENAKTLKFEQHGFEEN
jgi:hypothetical protein